MDIFKSYSYLVSDLDDYSVGMSYNTSGICRSNIYFNEDTGYGVYNFEANDGKHFTISGKFINELTPGVSYSLEGKISLYEGEKQLKVNKFKPIAPSNKKGIIAYLQTLYGLKNRAEDIYDEFKEDSINMLINDPLTVAKSIKGIGKKMVERWQEELLILEDNQATMVTLLGYGLSQNQASKLIKLYKNKTLELIQANPYFLIEEVKGYGFLTCDKIALEMGVLPNNQYRIQSGILYLLNKALEQGDCYITIQDLIIKTISLLEFSLNPSEMQQVANQQLSYIVKYHNKFPINLEGLEMAIEEEEEKFVYFKLSPDSILTQVQELHEMEKVILDNTRVYLKDYFFFELNTAKHIQRLAKYKAIYKRKDIEKLIDDLCITKGYKLEERQREACIEFNLYEAGFYVLTGSAGTGKTFTLKLIMEVAELLKKQQEKSKKNKEGFKLLATAPTGKAAKVASDALGKPCLTVHRALGSDGFTFNRDTKNPFDENFFICDETSMLDIELAYHYLSAIPDNKKVIFVGDIKQLESVGPGNVLKDIISSNKIKTIELNVSKRQNDKSGIIYNANKIIAKEMLESTPKTGDFFLMYGKTPSELQNIILSATQRLLDKHYDFSEIQLLIPQRTGKIGVNIINMMMQTRFNPIKENEYKLFKASFEIENTLYQLYIHKNDKVMHIKNNYQLKWFDKVGNCYFPLSDKVGITNGEVGVVEEIEKAPNGTFQVIVKYDEGYVKYTEGIDELELCYATTIHKSQGSAWKAIILVITNSHAYILTNNLLYTGVTRAREFAFIVGDEEGVQRALTTVKETNRKTYLKERLELLLS